MHSLAGTDGNAIVESAEAADAAPVAAAATAPEAIRDAQLQQALLKGDISGDVIGSLVERLCGSDAASTTGNE